ncbi:MAG TPA: hypothetical protein VHG09_02985, partial [Longimicrobiales bacterium]|nr:hypothetical protein [Longimicrobiales bacterium]
MNEEAARQNAFFSDFQKKLAASRYGAEAVNAMSRSQLLAAQQTILEAAARLLAASRGATEAAAGWWEAKLELEGLR